MAGYIGSKIAVTQVDGYNRTEADAEFVQVTGDTMTGALNITASGSGSAGSLNINATDPFIRFYDSNGAIDARKWDIRAVGNSEGLVVRTVNDANTSFATRLAVDPQGRVTMPYQPCFSAYVSSVYSASSTASKVLYDGTFINVGSHFNTSTNTFTAPVNGKYKFNARVSIQVSSGEYARAANVMFYLNGSIYQGNFHNIRNAIPPVSGSAVYHGLEGSAIINLSANDTISVYLNWESDGTLDASENVHYHGTYFEGHLLG